jgi:6-phosphogluconolactonase/glucosamine-6-phosphate isomerase/deaminase
VALQIETWPDADAVARRGAEHVVRQAGAAIVEHGRFTFAVSGGHTPWAMFAHLAAEPIGWEDMTIVQVDERVAQAGDPDRNLTHLREALGRAAPAEVRPMPFEAPDLERARNVPSLITGADNVDALARLRADDDSIPAGRISTANALVIADEAAAGGAAR